MAAQVFPLDRDAVLTADQNGQIADLGPAGSAQSTGTCVLHFVPSADFVGGFAVVGRVGTATANTNNVGFITVPYRRIAVAGNASDYAIVSALTDPSLLTLTGPALIQVSGNFSVGLLIACSQGTCWVYQSRLQGSATI